MQLSSGDVLTSYKYILEEFIIFEGNDQFDIQVHNILSFVITYDFELNMHPIFKIELLISLELLKFIYEKKNKIKVNIKLRKQMLSQDNGSQIGAMEDGIDDTFQLFLDESQIQRDYNVFSSRITAGGKEYEHHPLYDENNTFILFLFKSDMQESANTISNIIFKEDDLTSCIKWLCTKSNLQNKVLMSPLDNNNKYKQICLPPYILCKALCYLDQNFGFYTYGSTIFFHFKKLYILNTKAQVTAWEKEEKKEVIIYVSEYMAGQEPRPGSVEKKNDKQKYHVQATNDMVNVSSPSITTNLHEGTSLEQVTTTGIISDNTQSSTTTRSDKETDKMYYQKNLNDYYKSSLTARQYENSMTISCNLRDVDIDIFLPNKRTTFIFNKPDMDALCKGKFRPSQVMIQLIHEGIGYALIATAVYKKCKE